MRPDQLYLARNKGKTRRYKIKNRASKHFRNEMDGDGIVLVCYSGDGSTVPDAKTVIELTPEDAAKMSHMDLELLDHEIGEEFQQVAEKEVRHTVASINFHPVRPLPTPPQPPVGVVFGVRRQGSVSLGLAIFFTISGAIIMVISVAAPLFISR